jgi:hypothetical protein
MVKEVRMSPPWIVVAVLCAATAAGQPQRTFDSAQSAADALIAAAQKDDAPALLELFGPSGEDLIHSGDAVQDKNARSTFAALAAEKKSVVVDPKNKDRATLYVGAQEWPLPVPIEKSKGKWSFNSAAGRDEVLHRRIGTNELDAIQVCRGFVEAQHDYAAEPHDGINQYAQRIFSTPGRMDGLYWETANGDPAGPVSKAVADAIQEGYAAQPGGGYHGYRFVVLHGQGPDAPMGQLDYIVKGVMIGGFALLAVPMEYGVSGVKTFMVGPEGVVYQKDLGPNTGELAKAINRYNPDKTWKSTEDEWPPDAFQSGLFLDQAP